MPYADNNGVRIHYHVEGEGQPLVLQHGFTSSVRNWYAYGYVDGLKDDYQLIMIDARGHGESDKPHDSASYDLKLRVKDVTSVMDELGIDKAHYLGYSMGGRIGFGVAMYAPERLNSLIIGGMHPYESGGNISVDDRVELLSQGMEAYVASMESPGEPMDAGRRARLLANDPKALIAAISAPRGTTGEVVRKITMPCLLYVGESDGFYEGVVKCSKEIPGVSFVSFPGLNHGQVSQRSDVVLPHVTKFLSSVTQQVSVAD
jgi:pimeloyl-ACP methyl ester carboxylesterase